MRNNNQIQTRNSTTDLFNRIIKLIINHNSLGVLQELLNHIPMLKYLNVEHISADYQSVENNKNFLSFFQIFNNWSIW
jgi:hypothetical protein